METKKKPLNKVLVGRICFAVVACILGTLMILYALSNRAVPEEPVQGETTAPVADDSGPETPGPETPETEEPETKEPEIEEFETKEPETEEPETDWSQEADEADVTLTFGGVCIPASLLGGDADGTFNALYAEKGPEYFFSALKETFDADDLTVLGLDAVFSDRKDLRTDDSGTVWYMAPASTAELFRAGGVEVVVLGGARSLDCGEEGISDTKAALEAADVLWTDEQNVRTFTIGEIRIALCGLVLSSDVPAGVQTWLEKVSRENDYVIVYVTGGSDVPGKSTRASISCSLIDAGANLVVCSFDGELGKIENYRGGMIVHSLGSLLDGTEKRPERYTALVQVRLTRKEGSSKTDAVLNLIPCVAYGDDGPWHPLPAGGNDSRQILSILRGGSAS